MDVDENTRRSPINVAAASIAIGAMFVLVDGFLGGGLLIIYVIGAFMIAAATSRIAGDSLASWFLLGMTTIVFVLYECLCLYECLVRLPREGGGANIGLGILIWLLPFIVAFFMWLAFLLGWALQMSMDQQRTKAK